MLDGSQKVFSDLCRGFTSHERRSQCLFNGHDSFLGWKFMQYIIQSKTIWIKGRSKISNQMLYHQLKNRHVLMSLTCVHFIL